MGRFVKWHWLAGFLAGIPLLASGIGHLANPHLFLNSVYRYNLLPIDFVPAVASTLPSVTAVVGVSLVTGFVRRAGALLATALYAVFASAQGSQLVLHDHPIDCGCFVWFSHETSWLNVSLLLGGVLVSFWLATRNDLAQPGS